MVMLTVKMHASFSFVFELLFFIGHFDYSSRATPIYPNSPSSNPAISVFRALKFLMASSKYKKDNEW